MFGSTCKDCSTSKVEKDKPTFFRGQTFDEWRWMNQDLKHLEEIVRLANLIESPSIIAECEKVFEELVNPKS